MQKNMQCGHALDVRMARETLRTYPSHIAGMIDHYNPEHHDTYHRAIRASVRKLFNAAKMVYPKRMSVTA